MSMEQYREYQYHPLPGKNYIRLLLLYPARNRHEPVVSDLVIQPLRRSTAYAALSYSWGTNEIGDDSCSRSVTVAGRMFPVTQNLFEALQRLRSSHQPEPVWVDAICINQNDTDERNAQVSRMAQIYAYASKVVAWLGEGRTRADDTAALAILRCLKRAPQAHSDHTHRWRTENNESVPFCSLVQKIWELSAPDSETASWLRTEGFAHDLKRRKSVQRELTSSPDFQYQLLELERILTAFAERRYFSRRWIVQELYHPAQEAVLFAWGPCTYSIASLTASLDHAQRFLTATRNIFPTLGLGSGFRNFRQIEALEHCEASVCDIYNMLEMKAPDEDGLPLYNVLHRCSSLRCRDPRDILFAVCSLDPDFGVKADYRLSVEETFTQFASLLLQKGLLELLLHNLRNYKHEKYPESLQIPTWVPDLRKGFEDAEISYASLPAEASSDNVATCMLYKIARLHFCDRSMYGQIILSQPPGLSRRDSDREEVKESKWWNRKRKKRKAPRYWSLEETPLLGTPYGKEDPLYDARPGDLVCATRNDCLQYHSSNRGLAEIVLLRPSVLQDVYKIIRTFPSESLTYFGPNMDKLICPAIRVSIM